VVIGRLPAEVERGRLRAVKPSGALRWPILAIALVGLTGLYAGPLATGFLNDDYLFLEEAKHRTLSESLVVLGPLGNYFRPISRQIYFETLVPLLGGRPIAFHLFNYALFLGALALLADLLAALLPLAGVLAGLLYFATLPFQGVNLIWVSCAQDLLALVFSLAAVALFRRGRDGLAVAAYLLAIFSKESALPLPLALATWAGAFPAAPSAAGPPPRAGTLRRMLPFAAVAGAWAAVTLVLRARHPGVAAFLHFGPDRFLAAWVHEIQSLLGLDHPPGMLASLARNGPEPFALACFAAVAILLARPGQSPEAPPLPAATWTFGALWLAAFGFVVGPVVATWSSYYYTLAAVGAALLVGAALRRVGSTGWLALAGALLWWHAGGTGVRAFAVADRPWGWTSHLTSFYFQRAAALTDSLGRQLREIEPAPAPDTRFFFATLPSGAGFQMGNGALVRRLYGIPTLESHFYSQFSESTAADHPCRFLYWDGRSLAQLYGPRTDMFFQVGSDLLAFGHLEGARHAFLRGLQAGENPVDHYYWLGWTEFWLGNRRAAEAAWSSFGARDDSLRWWVRMRVARQALNDQGDTLEARRQLAAAIRSGIGRPEAHAVLGELLLATRPKYGLLELKIAATLKPDDWLARRDIVLGLAAERLDPQALTELAALKRVYPGWERDSLLARTIEMLGRRSDTGRPVAEF
jgi:hypothetical protein